MNDIRISILQLTSVGRSSYEPTPISCLDPLLRILNALPAPAHIVARLRTITGDPFARHDCNTRASYVSASINAARALPRSKSVLKQPASAANISLPEQCGCSASASFVREGGETGAGAVDRSVAMATFDQIRRGFSSDRRASGRRQFRTGRRSEVEAAAFAGICPGESPFPRSPSRGLGHPLLRSDQKADSRECRARRAFRQRFAGCRLRVRS